MSHHGFHPRLNKGLPSYSGPPREEARPEFLPLERRIIATARQFGVRIKERSLTPEDVARTVAAYEQKRDQVPVGWSLEALRAMGNIPQLRAIIRAKAEEMAAPTPPTSSPQPPPAPPPPPAPAAPPPCPKPVTRAEIPDASESPDAKKADSPVRRKLAAPSTIDLIALERQFHRPPTRRDEPHSFTMEQIRAGLALYDYHCGRGNGEKFLRERGLSPSAPSDWRQLLAQSDGAAGSDGQKEPAERPRRARASPVPLRSAPAKEAQKGRRADGRKSPLPQKRPRPSPNTSTILLPSMQPFDLPTLAELAQWEREQGVEKPFTREERLVIVRKGVDLERRDAAAFNQFLSDCGLKHHEFERWRLMHKRLLLGLEPVESVSPPPFLDEGRGDGEWAAGEDAGEEEEDESDGAVEDDDEIDDDEEADSPSGIPLGHVSDVLLSEGSHVSAYMALFDDEGGEGEHETNRAGIMSRFLGPKDEIVTELTMLRGIAYAQRSAAMREKLATLLIAERGLQDTAESREYAMLVQIPEDRRTSEQRLRLMDLACELFNCTMAEE
ncbi:MAG: hypothetical protein PHH13_01605 [Candidatus Peribacteraceae bacterium]|nr:hypothetical protein [Candidatus Peribacteraceae bacterium]